MQNNTINTIRITTTQNVELEYELASLGTRIGAYVIDMIIQTGLGILFYLLAHLYVSSVESSYVNEMIGLLLFLFSLFIRRILFFDM